MEEDPETPADAGDDDVDDGARPDAGDGSLDGETSESDGSASGPDADREADAADGERNADEDEADAEDGEGQDEAQDEAEPESESDESEVDGEETDEDVDDGEYIDEGEADGEDADESEVDDEGADEDEADDEDADEGEDDDEDADEDVDEDEADDEDADEDADGDEDDDTAAGEEDVDEDGEVSAPDTVGVDPDTGVVPPDEELDDETSDDGEGGDETVPYDHDPLADWEEEEGTGVGDSEDTGLFGSGPEGDEEMPLTAHIEEMMKRLSVVVAVVVVVMIVTYPLADGLINYLWNYHIPGAATIEGRRPRLYGPLELILTELKVSGLAGFVLGLPVFVYETYLFMRPGLYPNERRYYLAAIPTSLVLALVGVTFSHFVVLPAIFAYFTSYTTGTAIVAFGLRETFNLILLLMGYMALVFQIPLFVQLAIMMGLVTREALEDKRLLVWGSFLGLAFLVSPDPTGMAPIIIAATMIVLFEGTLGLLRWTGN